MKVILIVTLITLALSKNLFLDQASIIEEVNKLQKTWVAGHNHYFDGKTMD